MKKRNYEYKIDEDITYLYLTQENGRKHDVILDTKNLDRVLNYKYKWGICFDPSTNGFYARTTVYVGTINKKPKYKMLYLHVFLSGEIEEKQEIDHKNTNTLDNREENLRPTAKHNNDKNRNSKNSNNKSGYRNVSLIHKYYRVQLQINGVNTMFHERFTDVHEAGKFAQEMREKYYGEFSGKD